MKILVTGGAGYIGSFMVKEALNKGYEVVVVDNLERGHQDAIDRRAKLVIGELKDRKFIEHVFLEDKFDAVVHFAGFISMAESVSNPYIYFENNVNASLNVLEGMVRQRVNNFIFSSTAGVYGNPIRTPIREDHPKNPTNPYGESKLMVEKILSWYRKIYNINFVSLRYFNASGAAIDASLGEDHHPETHIIPKAIKSALSGSEFTLYGDDYKTLDGTCIRDYVHVVDLVEAHVLALKKLRIETGAFFYNVGIGKGYSNKQIIDMVKKVSGVDFPVKIESRRSGDAGILVADTTKIVKELRFKPQYSDIETIVKTAWKWHKRSSEFRAQSSE